MKQNEAQNVVIDSGSSTCRYGFSGEDTPNGVIPNAVGNLKGSKERFFGGDINFETMSV